MCSRSEAPNNNRPTYSWCPMDPGNPALSRQRDCGTDHNHGPSPGREPWAEAIPGHTAQRARRSNRTGPSACSSRRRRRKSERGPPHLRSLWRAPRQPGRCGQVGHVERARARGRKQALIECSGIRLVRLVGPLGEQNCPRRCGCHAVLLSAKRVHACKRRHDAFRSIKPNLAFLGHRGCGLTDRYGCC
jgi:hypothetical protein